MIGRGSPTTRTESATDPKAARAQIQDIKDEIQDNLDSGDTSWLGAFYNSGSTQVANLAATLNGEDGQTLVDDEPAVLTKQDQQILNTFAAGLASAGQNSWYKDGKINLANSTDVDEFNNWYSSVVDTKVNGSTLENDVTTYQNAMGLQQNSSLTAPVPGA